MLTEAGARRPARVLMTADAVGGVWTYALDLAAGLAGRGVRTTLAVLGAAPTEAQRDAAAAIDGVDLVETGLPLDWTAERPDEVVSAGRRIAGLARARAADLVHLNSPALAAGGGFDRPVVSVCHSCVRTWWESVRTGPLPADLAWRADLTASGYAASDALVAPSRAFARATAAAYGLAAEPATVHNGQEPGPAGSAALGEPFVLTAGRLWDDGKDVATLDRAAARLHVPVLAAGPLDGPNGTATRLHHARSLGTLSRADLDFLLARGPIFASLARYEPFGLAVLEAASAGCPLLLSDIPTFRELWDGAAVFVAPGDEAATADSLTALATDPGRRMALGQRARERAAAYPLSATVDGTLAVYASVLGARSRRREGVAA